MAFRRPSAYIFLQAVIAFACVRLADCQRVKVVVDPNMEVVQFRSPVGIRRASDSFIVNGTQGTPTRVLSSHNDMFAKGWTRAAQTDKVGFMQGFCIETYFNARFECFLSFHFHAGAVTVQGPYSIDNSTTTLLVTGAIGIYEKFRGTVALKPNQPEGYFTWTFSLVRITG